MKKGGKKSFFKESIREIVFGLGDSFVSTLGAVTGIAMGTGDKDIVILSGLVLIFVEAVSMAAGSYLSNKASDQANSLKKKKSWYTPKIASFVMGFSYLLGGTITIVPYLLFDINIALISSILITTISLFLVGVWKASLVNGNKLKSGLEMTTICLVAATLGFIIGRLAAIYLGIEAF